MDKGKGVTPFSMDRRHFMGAAAVGAGATLAAPAMAAKHPLSGDNHVFKNFDPDGLQDNLDAHVRMTASLDDTRDWYGWYGGRIFVVVGDTQVIQPLFDVEGFGVNRTLHMEDGSYQKLHKEVGYYKKLGTNEIIETWENPLLDGEKVEVFHIHNDPVNVHLKKQMNLKFGATDGDDEVDQIITFKKDWTVFGDTALTSFAFNGGWKSPLDPKVWKRESPGEFVRVSEYQNWAMSASQLDDTDLPTIPNTGTWNRIAAWLPWMLMGQSEGHLFYSAHTASVGHNVNGLPKHIIDYTEKNYPSFMTADTEWSEPNESSYEVFAKKATPKK